MKKKIKEDHNLKVYKKKKKIVCIFYSYDELYVILIFVIQVQQIF